MNGTGHKLYGTAASAGLPLLSVMAREVEQADGNDKGYLQALSDKIKAEIQLVMGLMQA